MIDIKPEEVLDLNTDKLWDLIKLLGLDEDVAYEVEISHIRNGFKVLIPLEYIINEWYEVKPAIGKVDVKGFAKRFKIRDFVDEKDNRDKVMREIIIENLDDDSPTEKRI